MGAALRWLRAALLEVHETRDRKAAAYALGVFFGFSPLLGLQIVTAFGLAFVFRLNRLLVFLGLSTNLPWIVAPWYVGTTLVAARLLGISLAAETGDHLRHLLGQPMWQAEFWTMLLELLQVVLWPFLIGPTVGAAGLAAVAFVVVRHVSRGRQGRRQDSHAAG